MQNMGTSRNVVRATYFGGCFCDLPDLTVYSPEFEWTPGKRKRSFQAAVRKIAESLGCDVLEFDPRDSLKAYGRIPTACRHRPHQDVRFDWTVVYR